MPLNAIEPSVTDCCGSSPTDDVLFLHLPPVHPHNSADAALPGWRRIPHNCCFVSHCRGTKWGRAMSTRNKRMKPCCLSLLRVFLIQNWLNYVTPFSPFLELGWKGHRNYCLRMFSKFKWICREADSANGRRQPPNHIAVESHSNNTIFNK